GEALALLSETLTDEEARMRDEGSEAFKTGSYDTARDVIDFAERLIAFQNKVASLADEWEELENAREAATPEVQEDFLGTGIKKTWRPACLRRNPPARR
ncbi:MAG: hypothetical protein H8D93_00925, partial [Verrucomicrobia bacterium]|nr:hypothetical protein [Verrucomicrobiota bacterium]